MAIRKSRLARDNFSIVSNDLLRDRNLSFKARGLLGYILSHSEDWSMTMQSIAALNGIGVDQVRSGIKELEKAGYVTRERVRKSDGTLGETDWVVRDSPTSENPRLDNPTLKNAELKKTNNKEDQLKELSAAASEPDGSDRSTKNHPYTSEFEEWWGHYPRKEAKRDAFKAFKATRKEASLADLVRSAKRYSIVVIGTERRYIKKPAGWLRSGMWEDTLGNTGSSSSDTAQSPSGALQGLSKEEVDQILGPDNYAPPMPPSEVLEAGQAKAWLKQQLDEHLEARHQKALEKINGRK